MNYDRTSNQYTEMVLLKKNVDLHIAYILAHQQSFHKLYHKLHIKVI